MASPEVAARLEALRAAVEAEDISYGELSELQSLAEHIDPTDVVLLQWAGVPEHEADREGKCCECGSTEHDCQTCEVFA